MAFHRTLQGSDLHAPTNQTAENITGGAIPQLKIIKYIGFGSEFPRISVISSTADVPAGIVVEPGGIPDTGTGQITQIGFVFSIDTSVFALGPVFANASGDLTQLQTPLEVGTILVVNATEGILFFNIMGLQGPQGPSDPRLVGGIPSVSANATKVATWGNSSAFAEVALDRSGDVNAVTISLDTPRTAGVCQLQLLINGVAQTGPGQTLDIDVANPQTATIIFATPIAFAAGDTVGLQTVTSSFSPNGADATVSMRYSE